MLLKNMKGKKTKFITQGLTKKHLDMVLGKIRVGKVIIIRVTITYWP